MIERKMTKFGMADIVYLTVDFQPTSKEKAALIKLIFDDGPPLFLSGESVVSFKQEN